MDHIAPLLWQSKVEPSEMEQSGASQHSTPRSLCSQKQSSWQQLIASISSGTPGLPLWSFKWPKEQSSPAPAGKAHPKGGIFWGWTSSSLRQSWSGPGLHGPQGRPNGPSHLSLRLGEQWGIHSNLFLLLFQIAMIKPLINVLLTFWRCQTLNTRFHKFKSRWNNGGIKALVLWILLCGRRHSSTK